jgi:RecB family exonuclease
MGLLHVVPDRPAKRIEVSNDAATRLEKAREWLLSYPADTEVLVIAHSVEAANDLLLSVVSSSDSWFGARRFTLNLLASRMAQHTLAAAAIAPASALSFTAVVARAIHQLLAQGELGYFAPVATRPGFSIAVARTVEELRMNEVPPHALATLERGGKDLAAILNLVETELEQARLSDRAALFRAAIASIDVPENLSYQARPLLLLDLALRSRLENNFIRELTMRCPDVLATACHGDEQTISALEIALQCSRTETRGAISSNSLARAKQNLFAGAVSEVRPLDNTLQVNSWPGEPRECIEIVRSIQAAAEQAVPFDEMAVLLNCPGDYRSHLEEAFSRAQIPAFFAEGSTAPDPSGRAMLALLACAVEGLSARAFAEYLSLGQVPDPKASSDVESQWVGPADELVTSVMQLDLFAANEPADVVVNDPEQAEILDGGLRTPARWERLLVDSAVIGGRERWVRRLEGLANELQLKLEEIEAEEEARRDAIRKQLQDLSSLRKYALPLIQRLADLPQRANWGLWLEHLRELALKALRYPEGVLATLADLEPMEAVGPVDLHEVQLVLGPKLHDLAVKPGGRRYGSVFVGSINSARGLSFQVVLIPGLAERLFPRKLVEDPILPDAQKATAGIHGLATRKYKLELERLALRIAIGAARERAFLSYPRIDAQQSRPRVPSFYALEAFHAAEGTLPGFEEMAARAESKTRARLGWPAPEQPEAAIDEAEYDLALLSGLVGSLSEDTTGRAHYLLTANSHLARALRGRSRRWLRRWTANDGLVDPDELARQSLARHQFSARSFSATALQNYASCPYRFFLSAILRLELRQQPSAIEAIDPLTRGSLFHETQFEVLTKLKAEGLLPLHRGSESVVASVESAFALVDQSLDRLADEYKDRLAPAIPKVWQDGINSIRADLREWLRRMAESDDGWVPEKYELSFGLTDRGPRNSDPDSVLEPVEIIGDLKLRGSIDLVERHPAGKYRVTDHKTGKARARKDTIVGAGKYLQPLLYALAARAMLKQPVESGRLYYCTADGGYEERTVALDESNLEILNAVLIAIRQGLESGFLPAAPEEGGCDWCDFLAVCGSFEEVRTRQKPKDRLVQLKGIRELR